jgi:hypothetical protein
MPTLPDRRPLKYTLAAGNSREKIQEGWLCEIRARKAMGNAVERLNPMRGAGSVDG